MFGKKDPEKELEKYYNQFIAFFKDDSTTTLATFSKSLKELAKKIGNIDIRERARLADKAKLYFDKELAARQGILQEDIIQVKSLLKNIKLIRQSGKKVPSELDHRLRLLDQKVVLNRAVIENLQHIQLILMQTILEARTPEDAWKKIKSISFVLSSYITKLDELKNQYLEMNELSDYEYESIASRYESSEKQTTESIDSTPDYSEYEERYGI